MIEKDFRGKKLLQKIRELIEQKRYRKTAHFEERERQRKVFLWEALHVLKNGSHEEVRDEWDNKNQNWRYAISGRTMEARELRVVVSILEKEGLLLITVYESGRKR